MAFAADVVMVVLAARVMPVLLSPTLHAAPLVNVPAKVIELGAVDVTPPLNVKLSVAASPNTRVPVLPNVTALVIELLAPMKRTF